MLVNENFQKARKYIKQRFKGNNYTIKQTSSYAKGLNICNLINFQLY